MRCVNARESYQKTGFVFKRLSLFYVFILQKVKEKLFSLFPKQKNHEGKEGGKALFSERNSLTGYFKNSTGRRRLQE